MEGEGKQEPERWRRRFMERRGTGGDAQWHQPGSDSGVASYPEEEDKGLGGQVGREQGGGPQAGRMGQLGRMA
jgi:hypothetical protein